MLMVSSLFYIKLSNISQKRIFASFEREDNHPPFPMSGLQQFDSRVNIHELSETCLISNSI